MKTTIDGKQNDRYGKGKLALLALIMLVINAGVSAEEIAAPLITQQRNFGIELGRTRVIYHGDATGAILDVSNAQDYPVLLESTVKNEDMKSAAPFLVTPPLLRLEGGQRSKLRIVRTGGDLPADRETMQWLCAKAMPPKDDSAEASPQAATIRVNVLVNECEKLLYRPQAIKGTPEAVADQLSWSITDGKLVGNNPTPFYMNFKLLSVGGKEINAPGFIAPFKSKTLALPTDAAGEVQWKVITDLGGDSRLFSAALH